VIGVVQNVSQYQTINKSCYNPINEARFFHQLQKNVKKALEYYKLVLDIMHDVLYATSSIAVL